MKCKCCNDIIETEFAYDAEFCDQYCAKAHDETIRASKWKTVLDFIIDRSAKPEEELAVTLVTRKVSQNGT